MTDLFRTAKKFIFGTSSLKNTEQLSPISKKDPNSLPEDQKSFKSADIEPTPQEEEDPLKDPLMDLPIPEGKKARRAFFKLRSGCSHFNFCLRACIQAPEGKKLEALEFITTVDEKAKDYLIKHGARVRKVFNDIFNSHESYDSDLDEIDPSRSGFVLQLKGKDKFSGKDVINMFNGIVNLDPIERKERFNKIKFQFNNSFSLFESKSNSKLINRSEFFSILTKPKPFSFLQICQKTESFNSIFKKQLNKVEPVKPRTQNFENQAEISDSQDSNNLSIPSPRFGPSQDKIDDIFSQANKGNFLQNQEKQKEILDSQNNTALNRNSQLTENQTNIQPNLFQTSNSQTSFNKPQISTESNNVFKNVSNKPNNLGMNWTDSNKGNTGSNVFKPENTTNMKQGNVSETRWSNSSQPVKSYPTNVFTNKTVQAAKPNPPFGNGNLTSTKSQGNYTQSNPFSNLNKQAQPSQTRNTNNFGGFNNNIN